MLVLRVLTVFLVAATGGGAFELASRPTNTSARLGDTLVLPCSVRGGGGQPIAAQWSQDGILLGHDRSIPGRPRLSVVGDPATQFNLRIENVTIDDDAIYECQVLPPVGLDGAEGLRARAYLAVLVAPTRVALEGRKSGTAVEVIEGTVIEVVCASDGAKPAPRLSWFRNGIAGDPSAVKEDEETIGNGKLVRGLSTLTRRATADDHHERAVFSCRVEHAALSTSAAARLRANFTLDVTYAPGKPRIVGNYRPGQVATAGERVRLECRVRNGNPPPLVQWFRDKLGVARKIDESAEQDEEMTVSVYEFTVDASDNGAAYRCEASNAATAVPLNDSIRLTVYYAPASVKIKGKKTVKLNESVPLVCESAPSHPAAQLSWTIAAIPYGGVVRATQQDTPAGVIVRSNISVIAKTKRHMIVSCSVTPVDVGSFDGPFVSDSLTLDVQYPPNSPVIYGYNGEAQSEGNTVSLTCVSGGGWPLAKLVWLNGTNTINDNVSRAVSGGTSQSVLTVEVSRFDNERPFHCEARHPALPKHLRATVNLSVYYAPRAIELTAAEPLRENVAGQVVCAAGVSNPAPDFVWRRNGEELVGAGNIIFNTSRQFGGWEVRSALPIAHPTWQDDGATIECRASKGALWRPRTISKSIQLSVLYAPRFADAGRREITVLENETLREVFAATGNPETMRYAWKKAGVAVTSGYVGHLQLRGPLLNSSAVARWDAGTYELTATNAQGSSKLTIELAVKYPAFITNASRSPTVVDAGATAMLVCEADAHPKTPRMLRWQRDGVDVALSAASEGERAVLRLPRVLANASGYFTCVADNGLGRPVERRVLLLVRHAPSFDRRPDLRKAAAEVGTRAIVKCLVTAVPRVTVVWTRMGLNDDLAKTSAAKVTQRKVNFNTYESLLEIDRVKESDFELYTCTAENELGRAEMVVRLDRIGPPDPPLDVQVLNSTATTAMIGWTAGFDGGSPQWFRIEYRVVGEKRTTRVDVEPPNAVNFTLTALRPRTRYNVRVGSASAHGDGGVAGAAAYVETAAADGSDGVGVSARSIPDDIPLLIILAIAAFALLLFLLNICLICCFIRRHRRRKLQARNCNGAKRSATDNSGKFEKAAVARSMDSGPRPVQMYGGETSVYAPDRRYSSELGRPHSQMSVGDDQSMRTIIEVDPSGHPIFIERVSPNTQHTYLLDEATSTLVPVYTDEVVPSNSAYADALRTNSLQRRMAAGSYAAVPYPEPPYHQQYAPLESGDAAPSGPLRAHSDQLQHYSPAFGRHGLARTRPSPPFERATTVPTAVVHSTGPTPYAEVRPIVSNNNDDTRSASPPLSTFSAAAAMRPKVDYVDLDTLAGDLV